MFPLTFGLACCAIEMIAAVGSPRNDQARFGAEALRASPRQADFIILSGRVSIKMAPVVRRLYDQMLEPRWAISMGACSSSGGMFANYAVVQGADKFMPIDVHVPGCPPRPEALFYGFNKLQRAIHGQPRPGLAAALQRDRHRGVGARRRDRGPALRGVGGRYARARQAVASGGTGPEGPGGPTGAARVQLMPDAPGLELIAGELRDAHPDSVLGTYHEHGQACLIVDPEQVLAVLAWLRDTPGQEYRFLSSVHGVDYLPASRASASTTSCSTATGSSASASGRRSPIRATRPPRTRSEEAGRRVLPSIDSCVELFPTAEFQEREVYDFFGIVFRGHPDLRRILMPEVYVGWPQRRDFPIGGEPVIFTHNEHQVPGWSQ